MFETVLIPDCEKCAALCCVSLAFDKSDQFPIDKPNGEVCPQLNDSQTCKIYDEREANGYHGCMHFDCLGAGQRVVQEVFKGANWRDDRTLLPQMTEAFVLMRRVHEQLVLLNEVEKLPLTPEERSAFEEFGEEVTPESGWTMDLLLAYEQGGFERRLRAFLMSLRHHIA
ncbi:hypothetical protein [uncultured Cohaesibacter sp.]|uniref:hypothetical protein n=1 Tax=uncultured Cohaesibacter sp. TaxID=1002546 RepID=UPI00293191EB|nr:hypothetical protein [uncultured Cohaesibacter sp.]